MNNAQIPLNLPLASVQYILNVLMERPFKESADLIFAIKNQADAATKQTQGAGEPAEDGSTA